MCLSCLRATNILFFPDYLPGEQVVGISSDVNMSTPMLILTQIFFIIHCQGPGLVMAKVMLQQAIL